MFPFFFFFFFFPPFLPLDVCCLFCAMECEQMQKRRTRVRQGARNEPFPWWAMLDARCRCSCRAGCHSSCPLRSPSCTPGTSTCTPHTAVVFDPRDSLGGGCRTCWFHQSRSWGSERPSRTVFPQPLLSGRAAVSDDKARALDTDAALPLDVPETEQLL